MTAPTPWKKAGSSAPDAARLLDGAEVPRSLDPATRARIARGLAAATGAAVGVAAVSSTAAASTVTSASAATATASAPASFAGAKLLASALAVVAVTVAVVAWRASATIEPPPGHVEVAKPITPPPPPQVAGSAAADDVPVRSVADLPSVQLPSAAPARVEPARSDTLERELALVDGARRRMTTDPAGALALLDEHAKNFGGGQLGLERDVLRIDALLRRGRRSEAALAAEGLQTRAPGSLQAQRARAMIERAP